MCDLFSYSLYLLAVQTFTVASATKCGRFVRVTPISNGGFYLPGDMMGFLNRIQNSFLGMSDVCL